MPTPDELRARLEAAGIPVGDSWKTSGKKVTQSPLLEKQKGTLRSLEKLLQQQIEKDQHLVADLHSALVRARQGGGN